MKRYSYWPYKEPLAELLEMEAGLGEDEDGEKMSRHVFSSQWMQAPRQLGGNIFKGKWFPRYTRLPRIKYRKIYADTAQNTKERNDYSLLMCVGYGSDDNLYLIDLLRGKWEAHILESNAKAFWAKHNVDDIDLEWIEEHSSDEHWLGALREMRVEDKSSGTGLVQKLKSENHIRVEPQERYIDKLTRAYDAQPYVKAGNFWVPEKAPFTSAFIEEAEAFTADDSHKHDDQLDPMWDSLKDMKGNNKVERWKKVI